MKYMEYTLLNNVELLLLCEAFMIASIENHCGRFSDLGSSREIYG